MGEYKFRIKIAERTIEVHSIYEKCISLCSDYLVTNEDKTIDPDFIVDIVPRNIKQENDYSQNNQSGKYLYNDPGYLESLAIQRKISEKMPCYNTFLMHGVVVAYKDEAYMFSAPSGVGKTTRARIWMQELIPSYIINGDKPFLRVMDHSVVAYGSPWCGEENWNTNIGLPLKAIFILERADNKNNSIHELGLVDAYSRILKHIYIPHDHTALAQTLRLAKELVRKVGVFQLISQPNAEGIRLAYQATKSF